MMFTVLNNTSGTGGGSTPAAADGTNRLYHVGANTAPSSIADYTVQAGQPSEQVGVFRFEGAQSGDALTLVLEDRPTGAFNEPIFVIPREFAYGSITIINRTVGGFFLMNEDSMELPAYRPMMGLQPAVERIMPGYQQLTLLKEGTATGKLLLQTLSLSQVLRTAYSFDWRSGQYYGNGVPFLERILANNQGGQLYLPSTPAFAVRVYSDQIVPIRMTIRMWDPVAHSWGQVAGEYSWTPMDNGYPDFGSIQTFTELPLVEVPGGGLFRQLPPDALIQLATDMPDNQVPTATILDGSLAILGAFTQN